MDVYRISKQKYSGSLTASGKANRWNKQMQFVIYTASSRALACLELVVHLDQSSIQDLFKVTVIEIPDALKIHKISLASLPKNWQDRSAYHLCQEIGAAWITEQKTCILSIPSSIIMQECNYIINTHHPYFKEIKVSGDEAFKFDHRFSNQKG